MRKTCGVATDLRRDRAQRANQFARLDPDHQGEWGEVNLLGTLDSGASVQNAEVILHSAVESNFERQLLLGPS